MEVWYAALRDKEDTDWGYGSSHLDEAKAMARMYPDGCVAVIEDCDDPACLGYIDDLEEEYHD